MLEYTPKVRSFMDLDSWRNRNNLSQEKLNTKVNEHLSIGKKENSSNRPRSFLDITNGKRPPRIQTFPEKFKYQRNLNLTSTPISFFPEDELIVYLNDRIYHLGVFDNKDPSKTDDVVYINGKVSRLGSSPNNEFSIINIEGINYSLISSESFLDLEKEFLNKNKKEINLFGVNYMKILARENTIIQEKYNSLEKSLKEGDSLSLLVKNYFFPITKRVDLEKIIAENKKKEILKKEIDINKIKDIQFSHNTSFFHSLIPNKELPILITGGICYYISGDLKFIGKVYTHETNYKKFISEKIKEKVRNHVNSYFEDLSQKSEGLKNLSEQIHLATSSPRKDFGAERISETEYVLFKNVGEYGVEWDGKFYLFPPLKIGIGLTKTSRGYEIGERAFVYKNPYYKHPYVSGKKGSERREICTAGRLNTIHSQIGLSSTSSRDKAYLMRSAKRLLENFEGILKTGHDSDHIPVDTIKESSKLLTPSEAKYHKSKEVEFFPKTYGNSHK